ncbi:MAG TPA: ATP synthase F1 subunit delta [Vicinamibacterales bacterium]|nr:ATP synthase F1 subunit delta [Vicinamibacterales bacterium]
MTNKTAALRYARALLDVAVNEAGRDRAAGDARVIEVLHRLVQELEEFVKLFSEHPTLERVLLNPMIPVPRKQAAVAALTARLQVSPILTKLIALLAARDRLVLLPDLLEAFRERVLDYQNIVRAEVTTADSLPDDRAQAFERGLARVTGRTVKLATKVDPSIIGGVVARIGTTVYDGSITTQLKKMKQRLVERV